MWMVIPPVLAGKTNDGLILNHNVGFLVLGFWCLVLRAWFFVLGAWFLVLGAWCLVLGSAKGLARKYQVPGPALLL